MEQWFLLARNMSQRLHDRLHRRDKDYLHRLARRLCCQAGRIRVQVCSEVGNLIFDGFVGTRRLTKGLRDWMCLDLNSALAEPIPENGMRVPAIEVRWQASDLSLFETPPSQGWSGTPVPPGTSSQASECPTSSKTSATPSPTYWQTPTPTPRPAETLSTGAKAGIGIGAALAGLLVLGGLAAWLVRRRRHTRVPTADPDLSLGDGTAAAEREAKDKSAVELPQDPGIHEADAQSNGRHVAQPYVAGSYASELPINVPRSELH